jgi:hypothetical protein
MKEKLMKEETGMPSWQEFIQAAAVFENDYAIVNHGGEPRVGFFDKPREHLQYTVTGAGLESEEGFLAHIEGKSVVVFIECMDRRGANLAYKHVQEKIMVERGLEDAVVFNFAAGGGVIQRDVVVRNGEEIQLNRGKAFATIMNYVAQHADVKLVVATDHDCRCGAEAFAADNQGWPERLGCQPGDEKEREQMKQLINEFSEKLLPQEWWQKQIVETYLVEFTQDPETDPRVIFESTN